MVVLGSSGGGCGSSIILLIIIIGNIKLPSFLYELLTYGFIIDAELWLIVIPAVLFDIYFLWLFIASLRKDNSFKKEVEEEKQIQKEETTVFKEKEFEKRELLKDKECDVSNENQKNNEEENEEEKRIAEYTKLANQLFLEYIPIEIKITSSPPISDFKTDSSNVNREIVFAVKSYKEHVFNIHKKQSIIVEKIKSILNNNKYNNDADDEKYTYYCTNKGELEKYQKENEKYIRQLIYLNIELLNENNDLLDELKQAFGSMLSSKKCSSINLEIDIQEFVSSDIPRELKMFNYMNEPITLFIEDTYFCLFSNAILVFDKLGSFSTALHLTALCIEIREETEDVSIYDNDTVSAFENADYVAEDSKCVIQGQEMTTWRYACRDGSPDLRYKNNYQYTHRRNSYRYTVITFKIGNKLASFACSSAVVKESFEELIPNYVKKADFRLNTIPSLLLLMKSASKGDDNMNIIINHYSKKTESSGYYCKLNSSQEESENVNVGP